MTDTDGVVTAATALSALAAWVALGFSIYNAYARRKDRTPRVKMAATWNLPRDVAQAAKGPGFPATADPGEAIYQCEITNVGIAGVKITSVHVYLDEPPTSLSSCTFRKGNNRGSWITGIHRRGRRPFPLTKAIRPEPSV